MEIWIWAAVVVLAVVVEMATTQLVCIWFAGGALAAMAAYLLGAELWLQVVIAAAVTLILLISTRPFVRKYLHKGDVRTNADRVVDEIAVVTERIDNAMEQGRVRVMGGDWRAYSTDGKTAEVGAKVKVERIEGVKLIVSIENENV